MLPYIHIGHMNWLNMYLHITFFCKNFFTYITRIFNLQIDWFNMLSLTSTVSKLFTTLITRILDFQIYCFCMLLKLPITVNCLSHWSHRYLTFSWTDIIWIFKLAFTEAWYSQRFLTFSCIDSIWVFRLPCVIALYSHWLQEYLTLSSTA